MGASVAGRHWEHRFRRSQHFGVRRSLAMAGLAGLGNRTCSMTDTIRAQGIEEKPEVYTGEWWQAGADDRPAHDRRGQQSTWILNQSFTSFSSFKATATLPVGTTFEQTPYRGTCGYPEEYHASICGRPPCAPAPWSGVESLGNRDGLYDRRSPDEEIAVAGLRNSPAFARNRCGMG